jgi:hypothetical protein
MPNTYTWNCRTVDTYPSHTDSQDPANTESDVVYNVHWRVTGTDEAGEHSATVIGTQTLSTEDLSGFTAFESVTHQNMIDWTKAAMGTDRVSELESSLDSQLTELATPTSVTRTIVDAEEEAAE